jgi:hypothetical protein
MGKIMEGISQASEKACRGIRELYPAIESSNESQNITRICQTNVVNVLPSGTRLVASKDGVAVRIVPGPFLGVRKDLVRRLNLSKELRGVFDVAIVPVRVEFKRLSSVSFLDPCSRLAELGVDMRIK